MRLILVGSDEDSLPSTVASSDRPLYDPRRESLFLGQRGRPRAGFAPIKPRLGETNELRRVKP